MKRLNQSFKIISYLWFGITFMYQLNFFLPYNKLLKRVLRKLNYKNDKYFDNLWIFYLSLYQHYIFYNVYLSKS